MASTTPNIGLTLPTGTEGWKRSVINGNFTILDTKIGAVGNTPLQTQINTLSSQITQGMRSIEKSATTTAVTLKFTFTGDRYSALVFKTDNQGGSSGIYAINYKKTYGHSVEKIVGSTTMPTIDSDGSINVDVHSWSKVTVLTDGLAEFS